MSSSHNSTDGTDVSHPPAERRLKGAADEAVDVTMVSTPGDGSCGIGTYTRDVVDAFEDTDADFLEISQEDKTVGEFVSLAIRAVRRDSDVIHVQHEYGLFRRQGSRYPGVLGLVFFGLLGAFDVLQRTHVVTTMHSVLRPAPSEAPFAVRLYLQCMHKLIVTVSDHVVFLSRECEQDFL